MSTTELAWTPFPGHHPRQEREDVFYGLSRYRGMEVTLYELSPGRYEWAFYDPDGGPMDDPDMAIAIGEPFSNMADAVQDMTEYIDGYVYEKEVGVR
jgi:hypothetical protein